jgi:tRNA-Thr(GGU) m(6)t(6)A37 methyltransferase TsaA
MTPLIARSAPRRAALGHPRIDAGSALQPCARMADALPARSKGPFALTPIGWVRSPYRRRFGTPQQAAASGSDADAVLEMDATRIPAEAFADLAGMDRLWVLSYLDRGDGWAVKVRPPRGTREPRGVFGTRSPDRPNPIGLSAVQLLKVDGCELHVRGIDLLDGTPILDVKPYVPYADAFPDASAGWIDEIPRDAPQHARYQPTDDETRER